MAIGMKKSEINQFEKLVGQVESIYEEMSLLSKKNPNDALNKFKLKLVNHLLKESNDFLSDKYRPFDDFSCFDDSELPLTSDVTFILSQYLQCFEKLRSDNVYVEYKVWYWHVLDDDPSSPKLRTVKPKKLRQ